ncbi:MAG: hypothetical protein WAQ52_04665 [Terriglobales bacterium]
MSSSLFHRIKTILDTEDIEGLLAMGCPADEYDAEASLIESGIAAAANLRKKPAEAEQIEKIVAEVWNDMFGPFTDEDLNKRRAAFSSVAKKIAN